MDRINPLQPIEAEFERLIKQVKYLQDYSHDLETIALSDAERLDTLQERVEALEKERGELLEALKPFAIIGDRIRRNRTDKSIAIVSQYDRQHIVAYEVVSRMGKGSEE